MNTFKKNTPTLYTIKDKFYKRCCIKNNSFMLFSLCCYSADFSFRGNVSPESQPPPLPSFKQTSLSNSHHLFPTALATPNHPTTSHSSPLLFHHSSPPSVLLSLPPKACSLHLSFPFPPTRLPAAATHKNL